MNIGNRKYPKHEEACGKHAANPTRLGRELHPSRRGFAQDGNNTQNNGAIPLMSKYFRQIRQSFDLLRPPV